MTLAGRPVCAAYNGGFIKQQHAGTQAILSYAKGASEVSSCQTAEYSPYHSYELTCKLYDVCMPSST